VSRGGGRASAPSAPTDDMNRGAGLARQRGSAPLRLVPIIAAIAALVGCGSSAPAEVPAAARTTAPAVVWAVGDGADGGGPAAELAQRMADSRVDRLLYLGDVYDSGTAHEFRANFDGIYGALARRTMPTPGNHDWPKRAEGYFPYWQRVLGRPVPSYDAVRLGGWEILSLNSEEPHGPGSRQLAWLRDRLRAPGTCRLAFWHRPRYSAGAAHGDQPDVEPLWQALRGHATVVLNGHDHDLQRLRPIDGLTEFVVGSGGHGLDAVNRRDRRPAFVNDSSYGALRLALRPGTASYSVVSRGGRTLDAGRIPCRPVASS
jgi:predicted small lipoprotein YifL